ncbi:MAG: mechanosensitive ion channel family protein [Gemmatimonadales bacterium]
MPTDTNWLQQALNLGPGTQTKLIWSLVVVLGLAVARRIAITVVRRNVDDARTLYRWQKTTRYTTVAIGILMIGALWSEVVQSLGTFFGLLSAGLAIALKDIVVNFAAWLFILWRRPFEVGDRIQIGEHAGDVIDQRIFQFTLLEIGNWVDADQSTGRIIHVPNGKILTDVLANYSKGFRYIWNEIPVLVTFESNWEKAKELLDGIVNRHCEHITKQAEARLREVAHRFLIFYSSLTPIVYTSVPDSGVLLTLRYLCDPRKRRSTTAAIWEDILREFGKCDDIDFAYPTTRFFDNAAEGKEQARAGGL